MCSKYSRNLQKFEEKPFKTYDNNEISIPASTKSFMPKTEYYQQNYSRMENSYYNNNKSPIYSKTEMSRPKISKISPAKTHENNSILIVKDPDLCLEKQEKLEYELNKLKRDVENFHESLIIPQAKKTRGKSKGKEEQISKRLLMKQSDYKIIQLRDQLSKMKSELADLTVQFHGLGSEKDQEFREEHSSVIELHNRLQKIQQYDEIS